MQFNDQTRARQHPEELGEPLDSPIPNLPPAPPLVQGKESRDPRFAPLRTWWLNAWHEGGVLYRRWEEVRQARTAGWHKMANWIKAVLSLAGVCVGIILLDIAGDIVSAVAHEIASASPETQVASETSDSFWAVIDNPVRSYIAQHTSAHLTVSGSAVYTSWQMAGLFGLVGGFFYSTGARLTWAVWGAASIGMVWAATPADSRTIATGIAVLTWTIASTLALRGLSLRPSVFIHNTAPDIRPEIHIPAPATPPVGEELDTVHPLQKR